MEILLNRKHLKEKYTIGNLFIDNVFFCNTIEDVNRDLNKDGDLNDPGEEKVYAETAIPYGRYKVIVSQSPALKQRLPLLLNVPHFTGIRIHGVKKGAVAKHTHSAGCILVGRNTVVGGLTESAEYTIKITKLIDDAISRKEECYITIV
jgi:hypothetical protein